MRPIRIDQVDLTSTRVRTQALQGGWTRTIPWPEDVLGAYGSQRSTDDDLDTYVEQAIGVRPGAAIDLGAGNPAGVLSACAGRDHHLQPVIRLSLRAGGVIGRPRRDPTAARVRVSYRVHPDTAALIDIEAKRTGDGSGQVLDRLAQTLR